MCTVNISELLTPFIYRSAFRGSLCNNFDHKLFEIDIDGYKPLHFIVSMESVAKLMIVIIYEAHATYKTT